MTRDLESVQVPHVVRGAGREAGDQHHLTVNGRCQDKNDNKFVSFSFVRMG